MKPLFLLVACAALWSCASTHPITPSVASPAALDNAQPVEVRLVSFDFVPSQIRLQAGRAYALRLVNAAGVHHDFTAPEFFAASRVAAADAASIADGQVALMPGQTVVIHLVPGAGTYRVVCTHTGHALLGMKGEIVVS